MKLATLTAERITELSLRLAMASSPRAIGLANLQFRQIEGALRWHRASCRPLQLARRLVHATFSGRLGQCLTLVSEQQAMLLMAADEGGDDSLVYEALLALSAAVGHYELRASPTPKLQLALAACGHPAQRARLAHLVRHGEVESTASGLRLIGAYRRRVAAYGALAMLIAWPTAIFLNMALSGALGAAQLVGYIFATVVIATWLSRSLFTDLRTDERLILGLNSCMRPHRVPAEPDSAADPSDGQLTPHVHPPDLGQPAQVDHS
ncbi:hypothetical protein [Roseateles sp. MS654]|uniref:hypothetical protein n=1 Tax=Roseateles sp. MS654 TaxID=3412685 RepID=UPI003C2DDAC1